MQNYRYFLLIGIAGMMVASVGCSTAPKAADISGTVRDSLHQIGLKDVSVDHDRVKGVVTLGGHVPSNGDKAQADSIARSLAPGQVIANQIAVLPPGVESVAKTINSDLDKGIEKNLDAALLQSAMRDGFKKVKYEVKMGVVTLTGETSSQSERAAVQSIAAAVPNVMQVVNKLEVTNQKATSSR